MSVELAVYRNVAELPAAEWDAVADPDDLQLSRPFLTALQEARIEDAELWFVVARKEGEPQGIAVLSRMSVALDLLSGTGARRLVGALRRWRPSFLRVPLMMCGPPVSFGRPGLKLVPHADRVAVLGALHEVLERIARRTRADVLAFKELDEEGARELDPLRALGYFRAHSLPSWSLRVPWPSWDEYLGSLRAPYRRQVRTTLDRARAEGLRARTATGLAQHAATVGRLYDRVMQHARYRMEWLPGGFFDALGRGLSRETRVLLVERSGLPVACAVVLHGPVSSTFLVAGVDWDDPAASTAYPFLVLEVVREGIRAGARRLELGQTSDSMKSRVGATVSRRWVYLRHLGTLRHRVLDRSSGLLFPDQPVPARRVFAGAR